MKITFISQASVIIETEDCVIWTDPWLIGKAFNNSWALLPEAAFNESWYERITHLWISHEHPDHFHVQTLKQLPKAFKERVQLLFQKNNTDKMPKAFNWLGFKNLQLLKNRAVTSIAPKTRIHNAQIGQMDSSLAVITPKFTLLNLNDCEVNTVDCRNYVKDIGQIDVVLNQFSMAGYSGEINYREQLTANAENILDTMVENHRDLQAGLTIPFASNIYFCCEDNRFINDFANTPQQVFDRFAAEGLDCSVLYPGESIDVSNMAAHDVQTSLEKFNTLYQKRSELTYDKSDPVPVEAIAEAFEKRRTQLNEVFPGFLLRKLKKVTAYIPDLNKNLEFSLASGLFRELPPDEEQFDIKVCAQPLDFAFRHTWGLQTLGVSGRYLIKRNQQVWRWYRIITSMNNAEFYLKPKFLFTRSNLDFLRERLSGGFNQLRYQLSRMNS